MTAPIAQFSHSDGNCAITGGYVYRGTEGAVARGPLRLRRLLPRADPQPDARRSRGASDDQPVGLKRFAAISSFGEDAKGNLYFTDLNGGRVYEIVAKAGS